MSSNVNKEIRIVLAALCVLFLFPTSKPQDWAIQRAFQVPECLSLLKKETGLSRIQMPILYKSWKMVSSPFKEVLELENKMDSGSSLEEEKPL